MAEFQILAEMFGKWVTIDSTPVNNVTEATGCLADFLDATVVDSETAMAAILMMSDWVARVEAPECLCGEASCGNVILPYRSYVGISCAFAYYAG